MRVMTKAKCIINQITSSLVYHLNTKLESPPMVNKNTGITKVSVFFSGIVKVYVTDILQLNKWILFLHNLISDVLSAVQKKVNNESFM